MSFNTRNLSSFTKFKENICLKTRDGKNIAFWYDIWLNDTCLANSFQNNCNKSESVEEVLGRNLETHQWTFQFRRRLYDWEEE